MWFRKNKSNVEEPINNLLHGVDLNLWDYLGSTDIKWNRVPYQVYFFHSKNNGEIRKYVIVGGPISILNDAMNFHSFVYHNCELWRTNEVELYSVIHSPSKALKSLLLEKEGWMWNTEKKWWVFATEQDKYNYAVSTHRKETPEIIRDDTNLIKIDFKDKNNG